MCLYLSISCQVCRNKVNYMDWYSVRSAMSCMETKQLRLLICDVECTMYRVMCFALFTYWPRY